jgi:hypothetical protein
MNLVSSRNGKNGKRKMNKNSIKSWVAFFGLSLMVLFPRTLSAQSDSNTTDNAQGYDYEGRAIVALLPFAGEEDAAGSFNEAVTGAVTNLQKYSPRKLSPEDAGAMGVRIPTDMPPIRDLAAGARYALTGGVYPGNNEGEYYLQLWLWDMTTSAMIYTDDLVYQNIDEGLEALPGLVEWLFSHIVEVTVESEPVIEKGWEDKLINVGVRSGVSQRWYTSSDETAPGAHALNFEAGIFASIFVNSLLSVQAEINFSFDNLVYRGVTNTDQSGGYTPVLANESYTSFSLMFPLIVKANFRPGIFRLAPFAGLYAFLPLGEASYRNYPEEETDSFSLSAGVPIGFIAGLEAAVKFGPGMLLADVRYGGDFDTTTIHADEDTAYKRGMLSFTLGYAFGFIDLKK